MFVDPGRKITKTHKTLKTRIYKKPIAELYIYIRSQADELYVVIKLNVYVFKTNFFPGGGLTKFILKRTSSFIEIYMRRVELNNMYYRSSGLGIIL